MALTNASGGGGATSPSTYYPGNNHGEYQFIYISEIIDNFTAAYVGEGKILQSVLKGDVTFHAYRALQELHYDTVKSIKSQEIEVCPNLIMPLPHDYVNYVKLASVDSNGIEHVLYPMRHTSNPFAIEQNYTTTLADGETTEDTCQDCGDTGATYVYNGSDLEDQDIDCSASEVTCSYDTSWSLATVVDGDTADPEKIAGASATRNYLNRVYGTDVDGVGSPGRTAYWYKLFDAIDSYCNCLANNGVASIDSCGVNDGSNWTNFPVTDTSPTLNVFFQMGNGPWSHISNTSTANITSTISASGLFPSQTVISPESASHTSDSWDRYRNASSGGSVSNDNLGQRYGLQAEHAQTNGSYYIDDLNGNIHFSSNISEQTIILKYLSDGVGTENDSMIHKFAEEAMYKHIAYGCASARIDIPEGVIQRLKKERAAETRKAKIRLSNIKIEEIAQLMRGKSKYIQH